MQIERLEGVCAETGALLALCQGNAQDTEPVGGRLWRYNAMAAKRG
jgi:hypothetical protein